MPRSDTRTRRDAEAEVYSDFDITFDRNPVTGALARVVNDEAVKQSIRNILLTMRQEWAYHETLGSKIYRLLFDPLSSDAAVLIRESIVSALKHEPRASLKYVVVETNDADDGYDVTIAFTTINRTSPVTFTDFLKRVR